MSWIPVFFILSYSISIIWLIPRFNISRISLRIGISLGLLSVILLSILFTIEGFLVPVLALITVGICYVDLALAVSKPAAILAQATYHLSSESERTFERFIARKDEIGKVSRNLVDHIDRLKGLAEFSGNIVQGDFHTEYKSMGTYDGIGNALLVLQDELNEHMEEISSVLHAAGREGRLDVSINPADKKGAWKSLAQGINDLLISFCHPLREVKGIMDAMSEGDLSLRFRSAAAGEIEELKISLNTVVDNFEIFLKKVQGYSQVIDSSSEEMRISGEEMRISTNEISSSIGEMSQGADMQVSKVDGASQLVEGILRASKSMEAKAQEINDVTKSCADKSSGGMDMISELAKDMSKLSRDFIATVNSMKVLTDQSREIERVLSVITEVAEQTNLLALNAAIEAAQAGDAGRGFSVVAEEIRKLADDSKLSVKEIQKLVTDVQSDTKQTASVIDSMGVSVNATSENLERTSQMFRDIFEATNSGFVLSEDILKASRTQMENISEVVNNMETVVVIAEQAATANGQISSSAAELSAGMNTYSDKVKDLSEISNSLFAELGSITFSEHNETPQLSVVSS